MKIENDVKQAGKMKEADIRPDRLVRQGLALHKADVRKLTRHKKDFSKVPCPACRSGNYHILFKKDGFGFVNCAECDTVFINPRPTFKMLSEFYRSSMSLKHWNDKIFPASERSRRDHIFIPRVNRVVELCRKYGVAVNVLLDVGAGFGTFCEQIGKLDFFKQIIAVEPCHDLAESCRSKGIRVIEKPIEEVNFDERRIGAVTCFELIEHLYCPGDFLRICSRGMHKGGLLILTTPNIKGFDLSLLGRLSDNICGPNHLNYFTPDSIKHLLGKCGFKAIDIITPGTLDAEIVRKKILSGKLDVSRRPFLREILIERWESAGVSFQNFLADNSFSSHMWVVARKT